MGERGGDVSGVRLLWVEGWSEGVDGQLDGSFLSLGDGQVRVLGRRGCPVVAGRRLDAGAWDVGRWRGELLTTCALGFLGMEDGNWSWG